MSTTFLKELRLQGCLAHPDLAIVFERLITIIMGPNASGKTSIKDGFEWFLTGACDGTDERGSGYETLMGDDVEKMKVEALIAGLRAYRSADARGTKFTVDGWQGGRGTLEEEFYKHITEARGLTRGQLHAMMNSTYFFGLPSAKQKEILFAGLRMDFGKGDLIELLGKLVAYDGDGKPTAFTRALAGILEPIPDSKRGAALLEAVYHAGFHERTEAKRNLKTLESQSDDRPDAELPNGVEITDLESIKAEIAEVRGARDGLVGKREVLLSAPNRRSEIEAEMTRLETRHDALESEVGKLREAFASIDVPEEAALKERLDARRQELADVTEKLAFANANVERLEAALAEIEEAPGHCLASREITCAKMAKDSKVFLALQELLASAQDSSESLTEARGLASKMVDAMAAELTTHEKARRNKANLETMLGARVATLEEVAGQIEAKGFQLHAILKEIKPVPESLDAEIEALDARLAKGDAFVAAITARQAVEEHIKSREQALEDARRHVATLEDLVQTFGPQGIVVSMLAERKDALLEPMRETAKALTNGEYTLDFDESIMPVVKHLGRLRKRLSSSERLRMGIAVQVGLAKALSFPLIVIDNADILDSGNKVLFSSGLQGLAAEGIQVIVLATGAKPEGADGDETVQYVELQAHRVGAGVGQ